MSIPGLKEIFGKEIGHGQFGRVFEGMYGKCHVALKHIFQDFDDKKHQGEELNKWKRLFMTHIWLSHLDGSQ